MENHALLLARFDFFWRMRLVGIGETIAAIKRPSAGLLVGNEENAARIRLSEALIRTGEENRQAFQDVYTLTSAKLFGICLRICGDRQAAEDVLHDVYLTIWKRAGAFEPERGSPITWLATIARNRSIDWRRQQKIRKTASLDDAVAVVDPAASAETILIMSDTCRRLHIDLGALDERQRTMICAAFFGGLTYAELAVQHGVPLGTVKSRIRRGLARLKIRFDDSDSPRV
ncbi:sigma-70 family RNA polymerase sigma factor [Sphingomonas sp. PAMC 26617]|uniref:sigma-70 family RNA polymerase sigma factor n=1 Tax=Sphingomonas sp. PAMC 26617 TaxID=1112216 RepID=UPI001E55E707|nr:sigma-70 family RNA polymerase sigma factor [Sphingomonas sp. PAMC 26617]